MNYRRLGDAGVKLSEIGLGGWLTFGGAMDQETGRTVMNKAWDLGINFFDSADAYAAGACESAWGELLAERKRADYVLATKLFFPISKNVNDRGLSRKHIFESVAGSLRRLRTDYIDLYQCHRFDEETPVEETVRAMDDLIRQGKILYWGFSEWSAQQIEKCLKICGDRYYKPKGSQPHYNSLHRNIEAEVMPLCSKAGIGQVVFSPLEQGVLTGKYKPGQPAPADSRAKDDRQNYWIKGWVENAEVLKKVQQLGTVATEVGCSITQLALAWILSHNEITSCIVGATKPKQLEENAEASGIKLDAGQVRRVEEILG